MARFEHFKTKPWPLHVVTVTNFAYGSCFCFRDGQWSWDLMREWLLGNMCHCAYPLIQLQPQEMLQHPTALIRWLLLLTLYAGRLLAHHMEDTTTYNHWTHFAPKPYWHDQQLGADHSMTSADHLLLRDWGNGLCLRQLLWTSLFQRRLLTWLFHDFAA